jgi:cysteine desulfurase/selenocysteine lyase
VKKFFPIFTNNPGLVYLDSAATGLKPASVIAREVEYLEKYSANIHRGNYEISLKASEEYEQVRQKVASFLGANDTKEVVFVAGTTMAINTVAYSLKQKVNPNDEIVVSVLEHHSNFLPWQRLAKQVGAKFIIWGLEKDGSLDTKKIDWKKVKILALTQVSNVTGQVVPISEIVKNVRKINPNIIVVVDGAQAVAHMSVDVKKMDCDYYVFSGHKIYGPTGVGVLWGKLRLMEEGEPFMLGGGMVEEAGGEVSKWRSSPDKYEAGTPPVGQVLALGAAIDFLQEWGWDQIQQKEKEILCYGLDKLKKIEGLTIWGNWSMGNRVGVIPFSLKGVHPHDVSEILSRMGVAVRSGHHCAQPLHRYLGINATTRASFGIYTQIEDIDKLAESILEVKKVFGL